MATFPVRCDCGKAHQVPGSAAGTAIACDCGRTVEIPSFAKLKASVGESTVSIDLVLRQMLGNSELPVENDCVICSRTTKNQIAFVLECEREEWTVPPSSGWSAAFELFTFGILGLFARANRHANARMAGRDVVLRLPVRVCKECEPDLRTAADVRSTMEKTELYRRLFEKYPESRIQ